MAARTLPRERLDGRIIGDVVDFFEWELELATQPPSDDNPPADDGYDPNGDDDGMDPSDDGRVFRVLVPVLGLALAIALLWLVLTAGVL